MSAPPRIQMLAIEGVLVARRRHGSTIWTCTCSKLFGTLTALCGHGVEAHGWPADIYERVKATDPLASNKLTVGVIMEREKLEQHRETIRGMRDSIAGRTFAEGSTMDVSVLAAACDSLAEIVGELVEERIVAGEHAAAVAEMIKRPGEPRMTLDQGSQVERGGRPRVIPTEVDPRD